MNSAAFGQLLKSGWRKARPVSGELRLRNGAAVKRINGGCKSWLTAQRSAVKQAGNSQSQAPWAAHSLLVCPRRSETARKSVRRGKLDFAWNVREAASAVPETDDLNLFVLAFQPVDDAI